MHNVLHKTLKLAINCKVKKINGYLTHGKFTWSSFNSPSNKAATRASKLIRTAPGTFWDIFLALLNIIQESKALWESELIWGPSTIIPRELWNHMEILLYLTNSDTYFLLLRTYQRNLLSNLKSSETGTAGRHDCYLWFWLLSMVPGAGVGSSTPILNVQIYTSIYCVTYNSK